MELVPFSILAVLLVVASIIDVMHHRIPNWLTYPSTALALVYHLIAGGFYGLAMSISGLGVGMAVLMVYHLLGMMGAGDVKMMGAIGAVVGPMKAFYAFLFSGIVGGIYALIIVIIYSSKHRTFIHRYLQMAKTFLYTRQFAYIAPTSDEKRVRLCYALAISIGTTSVVIWECILNSDYLAFLAMVTNK